MDLDRHLVFVLGTRPEVMKLYSPICESTARGIPYRIIHTGQHYDFEMSEIFFQELRLPKPDLFLEVRSGTHGQQTGETIRCLEQALDGSYPRCVVALGDTNSVLAAALVCAKLAIPFAHVEAGVRSFDMTMPEEVNRRVADSVATLCLAPTQRALRNLDREGHAARAYFVGDTLVEACRPLAERARERSEALAPYGLAPNGYAILTLHRSENVDDRARLSQIVAALEQLPFPVVYPIHPRAHKMLHEFGLLERVQRRAIACPPLGYLEFLALATHARLILTDSGGVQQEAAILNVPCLTLRYNTEWIETLEAGKNRLVGAETELILQAAVSVWEDVEVADAMRRGPSPFVDGAAQRIIDLLTGAGSNDRLQIVSSNFLREGTPS
jgi:UDP-N-acetylglucosamine 2-epimerase (non-hydrolysing)